MKVNESTRSRQQSVFAVIVGRLDEANSRFQLEHGHMIPPPTMKKLFGVFRDVLMIVSKNFKHRMLLLITDGAAYNVKAFEILKK